MLAGMFVTYHDQPHQVVRMYGPARSWAGMPEPDTTYELVAPDRKTVVRLVNPKAADLPYTPACEGCGRPAGFCAGPDSDWCPGADPS